MERVRSDGPCGNPCRFPSVGKAVTHARQWLGYNATIVNK